MVDTLPKVSKNPFGPVGKSTLSEFFQESTQTKSTTAQTSRIGNETSVFSKKSKSLIKGKKLDNQYFFLPNDNILKQKKYNKFNA